MSQRLRITGLVQGVGYRESMCREAARLDVTGWVRNRTDGSVEAVVDGSPEAVAAIIDWARLGPPAARVKNVEARECDEHCADFTRRPTA